MSAVEILRRVGLLRSQVDPQAFVLTEREQVELMAFLAHQYLDPNAYPAISHLLNRIEAAQRGRR